MSDDQFHNQISRELGGIGAELRDIRSEITALKNQVTIANGRTRKLEDWKLSAETRVGLISALVSGLIGLIVWIISLIK